MTGLDLDTGTARVIEGLSGPGSLSPDGTKLITWQGYDEVSVPPVVTDLSGRSEPRVLPVDGRNGVAWSPDGREVLWVLGSLSLEPGAAAIEYPAPEVDMSRLYIDYVSWQGVSG